jgi:DNA adenine methylase
MKYMGSKARFAKELLPIILKDRKPGQWYVEPFAGGMNLISEVTGNRIANDSHFYLIKMWKELLSGWMPEDISKDEYESVKVNRDGYPAHLTGWIGFNCAHSGKWFRGYAGKIVTKEGNTRDYQAEARKNIAKQVEKMQGVILLNGSYFDLEIPANSIVYCDPPYKGTEKYADTIDHEHFWNWVRDLAQQGHNVFVSEYAAPDDFECVWEKSVVSSISANNTHSESSTSVEKLYKLRNVH